MIGNTVAVSSVSAAVTGSRLSSGNVTTADTSNGHFPGVATAAGNAVIVSTSTSDSRQATAALPSASTLVSHSVGVGCRPSSLPALSAGRTVSVTTSTAGMSLLTVGLDSLADGHTGLTPLTGIPSCPVIVVGVPMVTSSASASDSSSVVGYL